MLGQRVGAQQQVLHVFEVTTGFGQTVDGGSRTQVRFGSVRAELRQYRLQRVAISTRQATATRGKATGSFFKAGSRINRAVRRGFRAQLLGQRVGAQQQVLNVAEITASFGQTVQRRGRAQVGFGGFRAELRQYRLQRVAIGTRQATTTRGKTTGRFREAGSGIDRAVRRRFRAQLFGQRVGTQQQVLNVLEVAARFCQTVNWCGRTQVCHRGFRAELFKGRSERIAATVAAVSAITAAGDIAQAEQCFGETLGRVDTAIRIIHGTDLLGQRIAGGEHVIDFDVGTAGFVQTVDGRLRSQFLFAGFRAQLGEQLVSTRHFATAATGQPALAGRFCETAGRIEVIASSFFRAQLIGKRVGAADHVSDVLEITGRFLQTGCREGGRTVKGGVGIVKEILIQHFAVEGQRGIEHLRRFRAKLLYHWIQRQLIAGIFLGSLLAFIQTGFRVYSSPLSCITGRAGTQSIGKLVLIVDDLCDFWRQGTGRRTRVGRRRTATPTATGRQQSRKGATAYQKF